MEHTEDILTRKSASVRLAPPEPRGVLELARHYLRDVVYGANDGVITTFAECA